MNYSCPGETYLGKARPRHGRGPKSSPVHTRLTKLLLHELVAYSVPYTPLSLIPPKVLNRYPQLHQEFAFNTSISAR